MSEEELININGIREDLYQAMQIGDITLNSKHSQELYNFMNYQDKEIERLNNIIKNIENICEASIASVDNILQDEKETKIVNGRCINRNEYQIVRLKAYRTKSKEILGRIKELKGSDKE